tara:strand:+ start:962 stop:1237 length:276 start_codon:yes stop_codon:yes gene_type:complete
MNIPQMRMILIWGADFTTPTPTLSSFFKKININYFHFVYCVLGSFCYNGYIMKNNEMQKILSFLFKAYIVYSVCADILVLSGIIFLMIRGF